MNKFIELTCNVGIKVSDNDYASNMSYGYPMYIHEQKVIINIDTIAQVKPQSYERTGYSECKIKEYVIYFIGGENILYISSEEYNKLHKVLLENNNKEEIPTF